MSNCSVYGKFVLRIDCNKGEMAAFYKAIADAPRIVSEDGPAVFVIKPLSQRPIREARHGYTMYCYEAEVTFKTRMRNCNWKETCSYVSNFIEYLAHLESTSTVGKIKIVQQKTAERDGTLTDEVDSKVYNINF